MDIRGGGHHRRSGDRRLPRGPRAPRRPQVSAAEQQRNVINAETTSAQATSVAGSCRPPFQSPCQDRALRLPTPSQDRTTPRFSPPLQDRMSGRLLSPPVQLQNRTPRLPPPIATQPQQDRLPPLPTQPQVRLLPSQPECTREAGDGVEDLARGTSSPAESSDVVDETELLSKLRCTSESAEIVAEREKRRQRRRCPDYPGLALSSSVFSTETGMKFSIIRNELHNVLKPQLRRVSRFCDVAEAAVVGSRLTLFVA